MFGTNWKAHYELAVAERRQLNDIHARIQEYNRELNRLELPPNGDDYNAIFGLLAGRALVLPTAKGR